jgi:hypothetical protein
MGRKVRLKKFQSSARPEKSESACVEGGRVYRRFSQLRSQLRSQPHLQSEGFCSRLCRVLCIHLCGKVFFVTARSARGECGSAEGIGWRSSAYPATLQN